MDNFPKRLKKIRKKKGLTQKQAADLSGISHRTLQTHEAGTARPGDKTINAYCAVFECDKKWLLVGGTSANAMDPQPEGSGSSPTDPARQKYYQMLDAIFDSGEQGTITAIKSNIEEFHEKVIERKEAKKKTKQLEFRLRKSDRKIENLEKELETVKKSVAFLEAGQSDNKKMKNGGTKGS